MWRGLSGEKAETELYVPSPGVFMPGTDLRGGGSEGGGRLTPNFEAQIFAAAVTLL